MTTYEIKIDPAVFNQVYIPHLTNYTRTQIFYGGSSSGKSRFLAQRVIYDMLKGGRNYLVLRQVGRTIRGSVFTEVCKVIAEWEVAQLFTINKSDMLITCANGHQIVFAGLDDVEKLKSLTPAKGEITDIWVEEATEIERNSLKQLYKRQRGGSETTPKRLTLSFNPILQSSFLYKDFFEHIGWADGQKEYSSDTVSILKTTYRDNRFLTEQDRFDLENEGDEYFRSVYTDGNWGVLGNVIFKNWSVHNLNDPDDPYFLPEQQRTERRHGLDFGFSSDPAAMPMCHYDKARKRIYVYGELYETGLTNDVLAEMLTPLIGSDYVTCDSSEPKSIRELQERGVNALGAKKGKDSVTFGIQWLQQQEIIVDVSCINMQNELRSYKWKEDAGGNALKVPVDKNNHLIDGLRYAFESDMTESHSEAPYNPWN